jgi:hypothetical protein
MVSAGGMVTGYGLGGRQRGRNSSLVMVKTFLNVVQTGYVTHLAASYFMGVGVSLAATA